MFTSLSGLLFLGPFDALAAASADNDADKPDPRASTEEAEDSREADPILGLVGNATEDGEGEGKGKGEAADKATVLVESPAVSVVALSDRGFNNANDPIPELDPEDKLEAGPPEPETDAGEQCSAVLLPQVGCGGGEVV
jgi:hypothetical protein